MFKPKVLQFVFEIELLAHAREQSVVPLLCRQVLANGRQIQNRDRDSLIAQTCGCPNH